MHILNEYYSYFTAECIPFVLKKTTFLYFLNIFFIYF